MPTQCSQGSFAFASVEGRRVEAGFDGGRVTSDAGALLLGATDRAVLAGVAYEVGRPGPFLLIASRRR